MGAQFGSILRSYLCCILSRVFFTGIRYGFTGFDWRRMGYLNSFGSSQNKEPSLKDLHSRFSIFRVSLCVAFLTWCSIGLKWWAGAPLLQQHFTYEETALLDTKKAGHS